MTKEQTTSTTEIMVKMSVCPECGNAIRIAIEKDMDEKSRKKFAKEAMQYNLLIKTITLSEYRNSGISLYCKDNCSRKNLML